MTDVWLTREEERVLAKKAQRGDIDARNRVIMGFYPFIYREAKKLATKHRKDVTEIVNVGMTRVIENFARFDPDKGYRASTYFFITAKRAMWTFINYEDRLIALPCDGGAFTEDADRSRRVVSLSVRLTHDSNDELGSTLRDESVNTPDRRLSANEELANLKRSLVILPGRLRQLMELRIKGWSQYDVADLFGVSRPRVFQLEQMAFRKLRKAMGCPESSQKPSRVRPRELHLPAPAAIKRMSPEEFSAVVREAVASREAS